MSGTDRKSGRQGPWRLAPYAGAAAAVATGAALRLVYHGVIEWKGDEKWSFFHAQAMAASGVWPPIGMPSSIGPPNPGLSLWVFTGLMKLFHARTPPELAGAVQLMNVAALAAFAVFVFAAIPRARREPWLWALGLWAVNPVTVILERKIWPPSTLPLPMVGFIVAWWFRRNPFAAFVWGLLGALMTQVHMGVAFLAFAFVAWTLVHDRRAFPWLPWLIGSALGALPAIPWMLDILGHGSHAHTRLTAPSASFYMRWFAQFFGYSAQYTLGKREFATYLAGPRLGHAPTYVMGALQVVLVVVALVVLVRGVRAALGTPVRLGALLFGDSPETTLIAASFFGYGGFLTLITFVGAASERHYMIVIFPIMALWAAMTVFWADRGAKRPRARQILAALCVLQAAMTFGLLSYIHQKGVIAGEFGASWQAQQAGATPVGPPPRFKRD